MAMYKRDDDLRPYEKRGIDPEANEPSVFETMEMLDNPNVQKMIETMNRVEGKPRLIQVVAAKAYKEYNPITKAMSEHDKLLVKMRKNKIDYLTKNHGYKKGRRSN